MSNCVKDTQLLDSRTFKSVPLLCILASPNVLPKRESLAFLDPFFTYYANAKTNASTPLTQQRVTCSVALYKTVKQQSYSRLQSQYKYTFFINNYVC